MLVASLLFGISASLDALLVGIGYGIRKVRIRLWQNLAISLVTLLGTCLSVGMGHRLAALLPGRIGAYAGSLTLIALGLYYIGKWGMALAKSRKAVFEGYSVGHGGREGVSFLKPSEVLFLSLTLSLNNLSAGLSASLAGMRLIPAAASTLVCSVLFLSIGNGLGGRHGLQLLGCAADPLSGLLLIGLGLAQLF